MSHERIGEGEGEASQGEDRVRAAFAEQAATCERLGSPFMGRLLRALGRGLDRASAAGRRVLDWEGDPGGEGDYLPLRLAGGLHALVRAGRLPGLARFYPPHDPPAEDALERAAAAALAEAGDALDPWLDAAPQTNEALRAATIMAGLLAVAHRTGLPLALYELGASAGLNLLLDRYEHRLGPAGDAVRAGTAGAPVVLAPAWDGPPPPRARVEIARRRGMDLEPLDPADPATRERLMAYVWADQADRLARTEAALRLASADPPRIDRADAADWVEVELDPTPEPGTARVLTHAIAFQYFPDETKRRVEARAEQAGAQATAEAPFAWLRLEADPDHGGAPTLRLRLWPDSGRDELLAIGHLHGDAVRWLADGDGRG